MYEGERERENLKEVKEKLYMYNNIKRIKKKVDVVRKRGGSTIKR